ncbi:hypothetical protein, partial [Escherichia coli]|uniref:hypothetical protein n=1 Tax=Escherichia coli TaxID=562 RepID=UPI00321A969C
MIELVDPIDSANQHTNYWVMCTRVPDLLKGSDKRRFGQSRDTNQSGFLNAHALEPRNRSTISPLVITRD